MGNMMKHLTKPAGKSHTMEEYVYECIKDALLKRRIRPLSQLVETTIAEQLEVSRTPVRAAIRRLQYDGYVEIEPMRGAFVIKPTVKEIRDTFAVRICLESFAVELAAQQFNNNDYLVMEKLIELEESSFHTRNFQIYNDANAQIHLFIAEKAANRVLHQHIKDLLDKTGIYLVLFDPFYQIENNPSMDEHRLILEELQRREGKKASSMMVEHLKTTLEGLNLEKQEDWQGSGLML